MIDLPGDCALLAAIACCELRKTNISCRALAVTYKLKPRSRHVITIFEFQARLRAYDRDGSVTLPKSLTLASPPNKIAKAWTSHASCNFPYKALAGEWY